ncbi:hypothetical protein J437_LFUL016944 [Ladona fulva]|uniref:NHR domain-containing protein n=1 Tax=Ladona fulva TaxID=123851 RepID=A0A8K0KL28_LADFU|nr:hypothetical protein J437_LFUL016944 [Ladona fulva]
MALTAVWITLLSIFLACKEFHAEECEVDSRKDRELNINVNSARNATGDWVSSFAASRETNSNSSDINVDVTWKFSECQEKQTVLVRGVLRVQFQIITDALIPVFYSNFRDEEQHYGVAITNRPLKDNELFEVRLDRKTSKWNYGMTNGVTTHDPKDLDIPVSGTWLIWEKGVYMNGTKILDNYIEHLNNLKVGDRLGIKRTEFGTLHVYINGVDKGPAASRVPAKVFGFFQLIGEISAVTIVDTS